VNHYRLLMQGVPESATVRACLDLLNVRGWFPLRVLCGVFQTLDGKRHVSGPPKGTPDYACLHWHYPAFLLETKRPIGGVLAEAQVQRQHIIHTGYHLPILVCADAHELTVWLDEHEAKHGQPPRRERPRL